MAGKISYCLVNVLVLAILCLFTLLVCMPLLQVPAGMFNQHWIACTASGVNANELSNQMDAQTKEIVELHEMHQAELMKMNFANGVAMAVIAHGLALMAFFGVSIQQIAGNHFGEEADTSKATATMGTWLVAGFAYMFILVFITVGLPNLSGNWAQDKDFGLHNCFSENPWFTDFEATITSGAWLVIAVLNLTNVVLVSLQAFVHGRSAGKAKNSSPDEHNRPCDA